MKRSDLNTLPYRAGALYAAEFSDGVVKIGCSRSIRSRAERLFDRTRRAGRHMVGFFAVLVHDQRPFPQERVALGLCRTKATAAIGKEWFHGLAFADAIGAVKAAAELAEPTKAAA